MPTKRLKKYLDRCPRTRTEIAEHMGISRQALYCRLNGKDISLSTLRSIAEAIDISLAELCSHIEEQQPHISELQQLRIENAELRKMLRQKDLFIQQLLQRK
jgi:transcriptional regulator with XRE-family HTH domain